MMECKAFREERDSNNREKDGGKKQAGGKVFRFCSAKIIHILKTRFGKTVSTSDAQEWWYKRFYALICKFPFFLFFFYNFPKNIELNAQPFLIEPNSPAKFYRKALKLIARLNLWCVCFTSYHHITYNV